MNNILASYKNYRAAGGGLEVSRKDYCKIVNEFNKHIMDLVFEGDTVKLPEKMGTLSIKGRKIEPEVDQETGEIINQAVDYGETKKLWARCPECKERKQVVYHLNEHSDNIRYKFFWSKERMIVENKLFYSMIFTRTNKRNVSQLVQGGKDYYVEPKKY